MNIQGVRRGGAVCNAIADGKTMATAGIQSAIDACAAAGGGIAYLPPGNYLSGTLRLKSNVTLYLEAGAILAGSTRIEDYDPPHLIVAEDAVNVSIAGPGRIDGQGQAFWEKLDLVPEELERRKVFGGWAPHFAYRPKERVDSLFLFKQCTNVRIEQICVENSPHWTVHLLACDHVWVNGVRITGPMHGYCSDGIDINASCDVMISNCDITAADDTICLKNNNAWGLKRPVRNITVTNCILKTTCNAFKIGTESMDNFENIVFSNSVVAAAEEYGPICGVALESVDGGTTRGICVSNIAMHGARAPFFLRLGKRNKYQPDVPPGCLQDVIIDNIMASGASVTPSITGLSGHDVRNVSISNIRINTRGGGKAELADREIPEEASAYPEATMFGLLPAYGLYCRHVDGLMLRNVAVECEQTDERPLLVCDDVKHLNVDGLHAQREANRVPMIRLTQTRQAFLRGVAPACGAKTCLHVGGDKTADIRLAEIFGGELQRPLEINSDVPADTVQVDRINVPAAEGPFRKN